MKNPFAVGESSCITGMLMGMVFVVFAALSIALLVEKDINLPRFSSSSTLRSENDQLSRQANDFENQLLEHQRNEITTSKHREQKQLVEDLNKQLVSASKEAGILRQLIKAEQESIVLIEKGKVDHHLRYREQVRLDALGQKYTKITTRLGKEYHDVHVKQVSSLGVSISHRDGASRLGFNDMPMEWQQRLMFTATEIAQATAIEKKRLSTFRARSQQREDDARKVRQTESVVKQVATLRRQIASVRAKYYSARLEASLARNKVSYNHSLRLSRSYASSSYRYYNTSTGAYYRSSYRPRYRITLNGSRSVPGSLETWEQRADRYERAKAKYSAHLASLRSRLISIDPTYVEYPTPRR